MAQEGEEVLAAQALRVQLPVAAMEGLQRVQQFLGLQFIILAVAVEAHKEGQRV